MNDFPCGLDTLELISDKSGVGNLCLLQFSSIFPLIYRMNLTLVGGLEPFFIFPNSWDDDPI